MALYNNVLLRGGVGSFSEDYGSASHLPDVLCSETPSSFHLLLVLLVCLQGRSIALRTLFEVLDDQPEGGGLVWHGRGCRDSGWEGFFALTRQNARREVRGQEDARVRRGEFSAYEVGRLSCIYNIPPRVSKATAH